MKSQVGLAPEPLLGGKTLGKVIEPFRPSFLGEVVINNDLKVSDVIEGIYMNLSGSLRASTSPEEFKTSQWPKEKVLRLKRKDFAAPF